MQCCYDGCAVWDSRENAEAALEATGSQCREAVKDLLAAPPGSRLYEVYEPGV